MRLLDLLNSDANLSITITKEDFKEALNDFVSDTIERKDKEQKNENKKEYLTTLETCDLLNLERNSLTRYAKLGLLKPHRVGGKNLYKTDEVELLIKNGRGL